MKQIPIFRNLLWPALLAPALLLAGCSGGSSSSSSSSSSGSGSSSSSTTYDLGSLAVPSDTYTFTLTNAATGLKLGIASQSQTAGAYAVQGSSTSDQYWHVMPMGSGEYNIENMLTHQVLGILNASTSEGAQALQYADNGTSDHLWEFYKLTDGNYVVKNVNSGYYLEVADSSTSTSATIDQGERTSSVGCKCQEWELTATTTTAYPSPMTVSGTGIYVHDPFMMQDPSTHMYWLYGTHQTLAYSSDLSTFTYTTESTPYGACTSAQATSWITTEDHCPIIGPDFTSWTGLQTPKSYNSGADTDVWAPSVLYNNGTYYQYYSIPYEPSTGAEAVIGLATSSTPYGPWTDGGYVISSWTNGTTTPPTTDTYGWDFSSSTTWNAIDPAPFLDTSDNWWTIFGSWQDGTHLIPLSSSTGLRSDTTTMYKIGYRPLAGEEGPYIYYWNGYYYYFASINVCCNGTSSTYRIIVGRSQTVTGPYTDRGGVDLADGGGTILLSSHSNIYGPGGQSVFTDTGSDGTESKPTLVYHYYDGSNSGTPTLGINRLGFDSDGWPYVE